MPRDYETRWPDCKVHHLVLSTETFIVFLDDVLDVDWATSNEYDAENLQDRAKHNLIINEAALVEATPCDGISPTIKTHFKRLIGEAIARSLDHDYSGAEKMLKSATTYIFARSQETSRWWYLLASMVMSLPFILLGIVLWWTRLSVIQQLGSGAFWILLSATAGAVGALLSVISRTGKLSFDCSAGRFLHYLEGASRILAGAISGIVVGLAVKSGLILSIFAQGERTPAIIILAGIAAGSGERLATSIISTVGTDETKTVERPESTDND